MYSSYLNYFIHFNSLVFIVDSITGLFSLVLNWIFSFLNHCFLSSDLMLYSLESSPRCFIGFDHLLVYCLHLLDLHHRLLGWRYLWKHFLGFQACFIIMHFQTWHFQNLFLLNLWQILSSYFLHEVFQVLFHIQKTINYAEMDLIPFIQGSFYLECIVVIAAVIVTTTTSSIMSKNLHAFGFIHHLKMEVLICFKQKNHVLPFIIVITNASIIQRITD